MNEEVAKTLNWTSSKRVSVMLHFEDGTSSEIAGVVEKVREGIMLRNLAGLRAVHVKELSDL